MRYFGCKIFLWIESEFFTISAVSKYWCGSRRLAAPGAMPMVRKEWLQSPCIQFSHPASFTAGVGREISCLEEYQGWVWANIFRPGPAQIHWALGWAKSKPIPLQMGLGQNFSAQGRFGPARPSPNQLGLGLGQAQTHP